MQTTFPPPHALALLQAHVLYAGVTLDDAKMRCFGFDRLRHEAGHGKPWSTMACLGQNRKSRTTKRPPKVVQRPSCSKSRPESPKSAEMGPKRLSDGPRRFPAGTQKTAEGKSRQPKRAGRQAKLAYEAGHAMPIWPQGKPNGIKNAQAGPKQNYKPKYNPTGPDHVAHHRQQNPSVHMDPGFLQLINGYYWFFIEKTSKTNENLMKC